jgi:hypothetical protein
MRRYARVIQLAVAVIGGAAALQAAQPAPCGGCLLAEYWTINDATATSRPAFPEDGQWPAASKDLGIAFSGGGTRSAAATVGQLRGLAQNGWLDSVRYITAVSGGSWSAVPFTYSPWSTADLLGGYLEEEGRYQRPGDLSLDTIDVAGGGLPAAIASSNLTIPGILEGLDIARNELQASESTSPFASRARESLSREIMGQSVSTLWRQLRSFRKGPESERRDKTYARLLQHAFLNTLVPGSENKRFAWNAKQLTEIARQNPGRAVGTSTFLTANPDRPFLIVGGSIVQMGPGSLYPALIPVEYTPLYSGVRQQFGRRLGGSYIWSWAYDSTEAGTPTTHDGRRFVPVGSGTGSRTFSLADVIASSGAAPQLALLTKALSKVPDAVYDGGAGVFPSFSHIALQPGGAADRLGEPMYLPHGDGGFTDNLGVMPLLARQVHSAIVFVNSNVEPEHNDQLQSYFMALGQSASSGDRSINVVFPAEKWDPLVTNLRLESRRGRAAVWCDGPWAVAGNERYGIQPYDGLRICFVYNQMATDWRASLTPEVRAELFPAQGARPTRHSSHFANFPHYDTFAQNKPHVIQLRADQVNVLANFSTWVLTNSHTREVIQRVLGDVLPAPPGG